MLLDKIVNQRWNSKNKRYYELKGYKLISINIEDIKHYNSDQIENYFKNKLKSII